MSSEQGERTSLPGVVAGSRRMQAVLEMLGRVAPLDPTVTLLGEVGTGRRHLARAIHRVSWRRRGPFAAVHGPGVAGAEGWTEAFRASEGGTLYIGAVDELGPEAQAVLYGQILEHVPRAPPGDEAAAAGIRLVVGARPGLEDDVREGRFREDLFLELSLIRATLPPLRERLVDIEPLANHFLGSNPWLPLSQKPSRISSDVAEALRAYPWPGNVAELQNCIHGIQLLQGRWALEFGDLPRHVRLPRDPSASGASEDLPSLAEVEAGHIQRVYGITGGNKAQTARILGVDRTTLYRKLERYEIDETSTEPQPISAPGRVEGGD